MRRITLAHGGGGLASRELVRDLILPRFGAAALRGLPDAATLACPGGPLVFSTDGFVVQPLEFPGGNIGHLAVHGTVNDLAVAGGRPLWLSLAMILEEGLPLDVLERVLDAVAEAAGACGVEVVTGDTKVVRRGQCDGVYLTTAGVGVALPGLALDPARMQPGDRVLASGTLGDHGVAVLCAREGIEGAQGVWSDTAPVHRLVEAAAEFGTGLRFMRDPTRGGLASTLTEAVVGQAVGVALVEECLPFAPGTRALAELLGLDLLHAPSEGRVVAVCSADCAADVLAAWRALPEGRGAADIGAIDASAGRVVLGTTAGGRRLVDVPRGELLPRIC
jgi:hydrogenase expression/formation protein HypE